MKKEITLAILRISLGFIFFWAFLDKTFGLGFATSSDKAWIFGNSPTFGFLKFATHGPFASIFQAIAGNPIIDWLFMLGLLFLGITLILGITMRLTAIAGSLMMFLMWLSALLPKNNPLIDEHIIYILVFMVLATTNADEVWGLGRWWKNSKLVKKIPLLK